MSCRLRNILLEAVHRVRVPVGLMDRGVLVKFVPPRDPHRRELPTEDIDDLGTSLGARLGGVQEPTLVAVSGPMEGCPEATIENHALKSAASSLDRPLAWSGGPPT